jgi:cell wall-associated NlpC family hydrolase
VGTFTDTGTFTAIGSVSDTGSFSAIGSYTETGAFNPMGTFTGSFTDTGTFPALGTPATPVIPTAPALPAIPTPTAAPYGTKAAKAVAFARAQIGKPYVWGATGPDSYDCASLTGAAWRAAGVTLPRTCQDQMYAGTGVTLATVQPGDLLFFYDDSRHVGIYIGNGMMIHAPSPGAYVREESVFYAGEAAIQAVVRPA